MLDIALKLIISWPTACGGCEVQAHVSVSPRQMQLEAQTIMTGLSTKLADRFGHLNHLVHDDDIVTAIVGLDAVSYEVLQVVEVLCQVDTGLSGAMVHSRPARRRCMLQVANSSWRVLPAHESSGSKSPGSVGENMYSTSVRRFTGTPNAACCPCCCPCCCACPPACCADAATPRLCCGCSAAMKPLPRRECCWSAARSACRRAALTGSSCVVDVLRVRFQATCGALTVAGGPT